MKFFQICKDGGPESTVDAFFAVEIKSLFTIALLRFAPGSRDAYHSHAFRSLSWVLGPGHLNEKFLSGGKKMHKRSWRPVVTLRETFHKVMSQGTTWVFTVRGPWAKTWDEFDPRTLQFSTLEDGRKVIA